MPNELETHPLVATLCPDPNDPPDLVALVGYPGPSSRENHWRIYHGPDLASYSEVPEDAIEHTERHHPENKNGPDLVLIKRGTQVKTVHSRAHDLQAGYLGGAIANTYLPGAATGGGQGLQPQVTHTLFGCPSW